MMRASIIIFIILYTSNSHAQPSRTGNDILPGCQAIVTNALPNDRILNIKIGYCMGAIAALGASDHVCAPDSSTTGQAIRIVAKYLEDNPQRLQESFIDLAIDALGEAWPCEP